MPEPLSEQSKRGVVNKYLNGSSYRDVSNSTGVSLGAVSTVIGDAKKIYPDIEQLRELRSKLPQEIDILILNKAVTTVLEAQNQLAIGIENIPEYLSARRKEIDDFSKQREALKSEVSELTFQRDTLQSEVNELLDKKAQLGKNIQEYEVARTHLIDYGIDIKDLDRLRHLLDSLINDGLDSEKCIEVVEHYQVVKENIGRMKAQLDELTMWKNTLQWSLSSLEYQHNQKGLHLCLKKEAVLKREQEVQHLDQYASQLKDELVKLEEKKQLLMDEMSLETEKHDKTLEEYRIEQEKVTEAYATEAEGLKSKVEALRKQLLELERSTADRSERVKTLNEEVEGLKKSLATYEQSKTFKEIQAELDVAQLRFFSLAYKAVERGDAVLAKNTVDDVSKRITTIEEKIGTKRQGNIVTLRT